MQSVGIVIISIAVWVIYCGLYGIPPIATAADIVKSPGSARDIVATARATANEKYSTLFAASNAAGVSAGSVLGFNGINPYLIFPVTQSWDEHVASTNRGAVDYAMPVGTPMIAIKAGVVSYTPNNGDGGNEARLLFDDGYTQVLNHLGKFTRVSGDRVSIGAVIALSGGAKGSEGAGKSTGPHLHTYILAPDGKRIEFSKYLLGDV